MILVVSLGYHSADSIYRMNANGFTMFTNHSAVEWHRALHSPSKAQSWGIELIRIVLQYNVKLVAE